MLFSSRYLVVISLFLLTSSVAAAPIAEAAQDWRRTEIAERGSSSQDWRRGSASQDWRRSAPTEDWRRSDDVEARGNVGATDWKRSENEARGGVGATDWKRSENNEARAQDW